jgi:hypothetical protein
MAAVGQQVVLSLSTDFENFTVFKPGDRNTAVLDTVLDQVVVWFSSITGLCSHVTAVPGAGCRWHGCSDRRWPAYLTVADRLDIGPGVLARAVWGRKRLSVTAKARIFDTTFSV